MFYMAKKKKSMKGFSLVAGLLGIVAIVMFFLPAVVVKDTDTVYNGFKVIFGYTEKGKFMDVTLFEFSVGNLLTFIFVIAGTVLAVLELFAKKSKFLSFIIGGLFIAVGIMFFLTVAFCVPNESMTSIVNAFGGNIKDGLTLGIGAILGGVFSILAGIVELAKIFVK